MSPTADLQTMGGHSYSWRREAVRVVAVAVALLHRHRSVDGKISTAVILVPSGTATLVISWVLWRQAVMLAAL